MLLLRRGPEVSVRCSSCETLLDRYVEGALPPHQAANVSEHLRGCAVCAKLLDDLKSVDALLVTAHRTELRPNFTFAVMAEVRTQPAPRVAPYRVWSFIVLYLAAAWAALFIGITLSGANARALAQWLSSELGLLVHAIGTSIASAAHDISHATPTLAAFGFTVLAIDIAVVCAFAAVYFIVRPRIAAHLSSFSEARS